MREFKLFIDGCFTDAANGGTFSSVNPATGEDIAQVALAEAQDVQRACEAAQCAFEGEWGAMDGGSRGAILRRAADLLEERLEEFA